MKKIATLLVLVCIGTGVYAQGFRLGVKGGLNLANQTWKSDGFTVSPSFLPSYHVGAYASFMFSDHIGLQPELLFMGQGAKNGDTKIKMSYIAIPIMVRFNVNSILSFHAGPQIAVLASAKADYNGDDIDIKDQFKSTDFGFGIGSTVDIKKLNFTVRFVKGLSNILADAEDNEKYTNYAVQVSVGYTILGGGDN